MCISDTFRKISVFSVAVLLLIAASVDVSVVHAESTRVQATVCAVGAISGVALVANSQNSQALQISGSVTQAPYVDIFVDGQKQTRILISGKVSDFFTTVSILPGSHTVQAYIYDACTQQDLVSEVTVFVRGGKATFLAPLNKPEPFVITNKLQNKLVRENAHVDTIFLPLSTTFLRDIFTMQDECGYRIWQYLVLFIIGLCLLMYSLYITLSRQLLQPITCIKGKKKKIVFRRYRIRALLAACFGGVLIIVSLSFLV